MRRRVLGVLIAMGTVLLQGCGEPEFPRDPDGTLVRAMDGELRVGVSENEPHTEVADDGSVSGSEVDIVTAWSKSLGAQVVWSHDAESELMVRLREGELDVVIGGLADDSPWTTHAALTRPYAETVGPDGSTVRLVIATRPGENALLSNLERFLIDEGLQP